MRTIGCSFIVTPNLGAPKHKEYLIAGRRAPIAQTRINHRVSLMFFECPSHRRPHFRHPMNNHDTCHGYGPMTASTPGRELIECDFGSTVARVIPPHRRSERRHPRRRRPPPRHDLRRSRHLRPWPSSQLWEPGLHQYVVDYYGEIHPVKETALVDNESLVSSPWLGLLGADLEVLFRQTWLSLGLNPPCRSTTRCSTC
jgi:hypothetical protein